ncbi:MAG: 6,7-dimethyl-8-ribityllumazine synthase [Acidobacteria bacterium]|jgi:6,7-dimethyl-8-ribityllumazine synthase|nr:6,7-dimethyl-8-ribityllumazine synthase [Acidobacteriota bacterium]MDP7338951.1 6,7-dimethyl-8-ribityllumazine synthase [Vicinamibacterales bacterium]MDP7479696.1 6,7-dimethyl-8-ribityllumazine synthase [Vicinamibacterales bacterium]MDP7691325.1 6,7-dimethyl-8-ribityllumazine synthase [Vicinamibacterales bacterium]HJN43653.1 6,7-dimethyl-8-ribityllumazine synthase [Vicinamibacterales bacterium]|tara:strand:+ start:8180 stop:8671 length:492 start_codon:yes stop_codon:yes gene_type:complete
METLTGIGEAGDFRVGIVVSTYNDFVTARLRHGAVEALRAAGVSDDAIVLLTVPGAFEIPQAARRLAAFGGVDAVIGLGCLIRGETPHFDIIASAVAHGIAEAAMDSGTPMTFGVLTTNSAEEALARAADGPSNKGREAAEAALAMIRLFRQLTPPVVPELGG